ncbi:hypothetical protein [Rheinheimera soli]|uniref:hypothetical protein n=1 Tax=Rheinheimera soli TaxID=443616 RepID=UPI001E523EE3|nr:hypothetical protein [Rheinheimera soli]
MKIWIFSIVVHALLLWALSFVVIPTPEKPSASTVIQSYSYTAIRAKPAPAIVAAEQQVIIKNKTPQSVLSAKKNTAVSKAKTSETTAVTPAAELKSALEATANAEMREEKPTEAAGPMSLADRALASVTAKASEPMTEWNQQREVVVRSINPVDTDLAPDMFKPVKAFTDGSSLINAHGVCWRVPPPDAGKNALWLFAGTSCNDDTTVDQIKDILQKRRTYAND